jgi:hypothetical protein
LKPVDRSEHSTVSGRLLGWAPELADFQARTLRGRVIGTARRSGQPTGCRTFGTVVGTESEADEPIPRAVADISHGPVDPFDPALLTTHLAGAPDAEQVVLAGAACIRTERTWPADPAHGIPPPHRRVDCLLPFPATRTAGSWPYSPRCGPTTTPRTRPANGSRCSTRS